MNVSGKLVEDSSRHFGTKESGLGMLQMRSLKPF